MRYDRPQTWTREVGLPAALALGLFWPVAFAAGLLVALVVTAVVLVVGIGLGTRRRSEALRRSGGRWNDPYAD